LGVVGRKASNYSRLPQVNPQSMARNIPLPPHAPVPVLRLLDRHRPPPADAAAVATAPSWRLRLLRWWAERIGPR